MSAFQVSNKHISAIVTFGVAAGIVADIAKTGKVLTLANHLSIVARYNDTDKAPRFRFVAAPVLSPVQIVKLCNCFDYQACEAEGYEATFTAMLVDRIRAAAVDASGHVGESRKMPGYNEAEWAI